MDFLFYISALVLLLCLVGLSWFAGSDAPFVPSKDKKVKKALKAAGVKKGHIFYELGSGDGRVVFEAAKSGASATGIEQSWIRVWYSRYKAKKLRLPNAVFLHGDIFERDYYPADFVYIYLLQPAVDRLEKKLAKELKKGAVVITQKYHFTNWQPFLSLDEFNFYRQPA